MVPNAPSTGGVTLSTKDVSCLLHPSVTEAGHNVDFVQERGKCDLEAHSNLDFKHTSTLSNHEALLYDRQIRLWGIEAQRKMMDASIMFLGKNGIQEEAIKNLLLAGMNVTLANDLLVTEQDVKHSFFLMESDVGSNHAEALVHRLREMILDKNKVESINNGMVKDIYVEGTQTYEMDDVLLARYDAVVFAVETYPLTKMVSAKPMYLFELINVYNNSTQQSKRIVMPRFPRNCDTSIKTIVAYLLIQSWCPAVITDTYTITRIMHQVEDICHVVEANVDEVLTFFETQGKHCAITSGVLGGYLALEIRKFVTKQHETIPSLCVFDMSRSARDGNSWWAKMKSTSFLQLVLTITFSTTPIPALRLLKRSNTVCCGSYLCTNPASTVSDGNFGTSSTHDGKIYGDQNVQNYRSCFLYNTKHGAHSDRAARITGLSSRDKGKEVDEVFRTLCSSLKSKKTTFIDLQHRLQAAGITLEGCKTPEDVVLRVAKLEVLGKERVADEICKSNPTFQTLLNDVLTGNITAYSRKNDRDRVQYIQKMKDTLNAKNIAFDPNGTDDEIIKLVSEVESRDMIAFQVPSTKPCNEMSQRIDSYKDEADSIFAVYKRIKDDRIRNYFISQVKDELQSLSVDYNDCKKDEDYINRLAYGRVFPSEVKLSTGPHNAASNHSAYVPSDDVGIDDFDPFSAMFGLGGAQGLFDINDGIFDNTSGMSSIFEEDGSMGGGFSILKDIAKMFGVNLGNDKKNKIVFEHQDLPGASQARESTDDIMPTEQEPDHELQDAFVKVKDSKDQVLLQLLTKSAKDPTLRKALKIAFSDGYETARERYINDKSALYILEKFHERGMF
ncbi:SUMO-activating enzyme subunit 1 [Babesia sp. Xinjiang]|uniref:SUMO-activating enzyme subunit 1 n=1 Tax=Babesia sp. Xinjiang TaxID=462227 RepID=UPI000A21BC77|nr:SUMO-activating enzyme subunit 1 [Babesia sp. Xinjiang]ORM40444.1 SUMO-activating enzyme subunit 1 [Babesia sp. Xinjiang]